MQFIEQKLKRNCGHIAVAALTDAPLEKVTAIIGHKHGTKTKDLRRALLALGYTCPEKASAQAWQKAQETFWEACGIAQVHQAGRGGWHWVAVGRGPDGHTKVYDGHRSKPLDLADYVRYVRIAYGWEITSFLPVQKHICQFEEQPGEPPFDVCPSCGAVRQ